MKNASDFDRDVQGKSGQSNGVKSAFQTAFSPQGIFSQVARYAKVNVDEAPAGGEGQDDEEEGKMLVVAIVVMCSVALLAIVDEVTTKFGHTASARLAVWTLDNAPGSFVAFELIISLLIMCCLPYGPLAVLSGALFEAKYGTVGVVVAGLVLFCSTLGGEIACFFLARYKFRRVVQRQIENSEKLSVLKNLDRLIQEGQGIEMVMLLRLAPFPKGPANYFLGTTSVTLREFLIGSTIVNLPLCYIDVLIGAGAKHVNKNSHGAVIAFVIVVASFFCLIAWVGLRAKKKLESFKAAETAEKFKDFNSAAAGESSPSSGPSGGAGGSLPDGASSDQIPPKEDRVDPDGVAVTEEPPRSPEEHTEDDHAQEGSQQGGSGEQMV